MLKDKFDRSIKVGDLALIGAGGTPRLFVAKVISLIEDEFDSMVELAMLDDMLDRMEVMTTTRWPEELILIDGKILSEKYSKQLKRFK